MGMRQHRAVLIVVATMLGFSSFAIPSGDAYGVRSDTKASNPQKLKLSDAVSSSVCSGTPVSGGSLVYARGTSTESLDPLDILNGNGDIFADNLIYEGLTSFNPQGKIKIQPAIAESWTISPNGRVYTFKLRPGVKFSNGQPVTAQDVAWSLNQFGNPKTNIVMGVLAVGYGNAVAVNSSTVQISLPHPVAAFLNDISTFPAFVLPENLVKKEGIANFSKNPVGSGPFKFSSFVSGSHVTFVRNPYYWNKPLPYLDKVTFNFAIDSNSRLLDLESGQAQIADLITPSQIPTVEANKKLVLASHKIPLMISLFPNELYKPLKNLDVRLAIADAIDRKKIISQIFHGIGTVPNSVLPAPMLYDGNYKQVPPYKYNVTQAKKLMSEAGYPHGFNMTLQYPTGLDFFSQMSLLVKQELSAIGINVTLVPLASTTLTNNWQNKKYQLSWAFPNVSADIPAPDEYANFYTDPGKTGLDGFFTSWKSLSIWAMVQKFDSTVSNASRAEQWPKIQEALMLQQPGISVVDIPILSAHATNVCGADVNILGVDELQDTWLAPSK
jgi:peptide/nickel transport system substrate-binding protein